MRRLLYTFLYILACWPLLVSVAPAPAPVVATLHLAPPAAAPARVEVRALPVLPRPQQVVVVPLPASLPTPVEGCTRANALYYLEARVDIRGNAAAWSCRSLDEARQYLEFHIGLVTGG